MNKTIIVTCIAALFGSAAIAQDASKEIRVKKLKVVVAPQMTPGLQAQFVTEKRWKPKTWIEIDSEFDVDIARTLGGDDAAYGALEFEYYLATTARSKDGKVIVLAGKISYTSIPAGENHALAYVSPANLRRALKKDDGGKNDIIASAVVVTAGGQPMAVENTQNGKWWEDTAKFELLSDTVVAKNKTPFAPLWGDYDVQTDSK